METLSRRYLVVLAILLMAGAGPVKATPMDWGRDANGNPLTPLRFPAGSTINVFIEPDPDANPPDRSALLREGIQRWQSEMSSRGITVNVSVGSPPSPPPANTVEVNWEPDGTTRGTPPDQLALGPGPPRIDAIASPSDNGSNLNGGEVIIRDSLDGLGDENANFLRNLGAHEFAHILGLADDSAGSVTDHDQPNEPAPFNETDRREISTLYPLTGNSQPRSIAHSLPAGADPALFEWDFVYDGSPDDHVSLILLHVDPGVISDVFAPAGWIVLNPADPAHKSRSYPFYEDYAEEWSCSQPTWGAGFTAPLSLRAMSEADTMSVDHPLLHVGLLTTNAERGPVDVWAGGDPQVVEGPVAPTDCGNGIIDPGEDCDGNNDAACPGKCSGTCECPLLVELDSFSAEVVRSGVRLRWTTAVELDNAGFRLLRQSSDRREKSVDVVTAGLIPAKGNNLVGAAYEVLDSASGLEGRVRYDLEAVDVWGRVTRVGSVTVDLARETPRRGSQTRGR